MRAQAHGTACSLQLGGFVRRTVPQSAMESSGGTLDSRERTLILPPKMTWVRPEAAAPVGVRVLPLPHLTASVSLCTLLPGQHVHLRGKVCFTRTIPGLGLSNNKGGTHGRLPDFPSGGRAGQPLRQGRDRSVLYFPQDHAVPSEARGSAASLLPAFSPAHPWRVPSPL